MKNTLIFFLAITMLSLFTTSAEAQCHKKIYIVGEKCTGSDVSINTTVLNPMTNSYVDNILEKDANFQANQEISYQISITNKAYTSINQVMIKNTLPPLVNFIDGSGEYNSVSRTLTTQIGTMNIGETKKIIITAKIAESNQLPANKEIICIVSQATALAQNDQKANDEAKICFKNKITTPIIQSIQAKVVETQQAIITKDAQKIIYPTGEEIITKGGLKIFPPPKINKTPATGSKILILFGLLATGLFGQFLRKKYIH
ncbi:MAG: hypothetical protein NTZ20_03295 [Candidatus Levybacteria bacterium]|nr:hypothetical protein [Candidatus Levybacteria bacterium]